MEKQAVSETMPGPLVDRLTRRADHLRGLAERHNTDRIHSQEPPWLLREPCDIGGYHVPAGTFAVASLWDLHRNPDLYADPEEFRPERFLGNRPPRGSWLPFGSGTHACIGGQLAFLHVTVLVHTLIRSGQLLPTTRQDEGIRHRASTEPYPAQGCRVTPRPVRGRHPQGAR
ncbi:cytochrome P450 [Streptomyces sp. NPDC059459]|uniref:cytochrome P450 n=1 Tax=Streptomyces sp. NPDC059459 TaxID=3346839 RepID=UPI0036A261DD